MKKKEEKINRLLDDLFIIKNTKMSYSNLANKSLKEFDEEQLINDRIYIIKKKLDKLNG